MGCLCCGETSTLVGTYDSKDRAEILCEELNAEYGSRNIKYVMLTQNPDDLNVELDSQPIY